jgi:hypothetical protein
MIAGFTENFSIGFVHPNLIEHSHPVSKTLAILAFQKPIFLFKTINFYKTPHIPLFILQYILLKYYKIIFLLLLFFPTLSQIPRQQAPLFSCLT